MNDDDITKTSESRIENDTSRTHLMQDASMLKSIECTDDISQGKAEGRNPDAPRYTMGQMRDYAQAFHQSRMGLLQPKWISVEDRLPEFGRFVLIAFADGGVDMSSRIRWKRQEDWFWEGVSKTHHEPPTHWMMLPSAPALIVTSGEDSHDPQSCNPNCAYCKASPAASGER